jgi:PIN domain nuclease of toxin-antitoxin system
LKTIQDGKYEALLLSAISIWEFSKLVEKRRLMISCDGKEWINQALEIPKLRVVGLTPEISWLSTQLPQPFHDDPADQIIVATARAENAVLLSADRLLREYPHVRTEW